MSPPHSPCQTDSVGGHVPHASPFAASDRLLWFGSSAWRHTVPAGILVSQVHGFQPYFWIQVPSHTFKSLAPTTLTETATKPSGRTFRSHGPAGLSRALHPLGTRPSACARAARDQSVLCDDACVRLRRAASVVCRSPTTALTAAHSRRS